LYIIARLPLTDSDDYESEGHLGERDNGRGRRCERARRVELDPWRLRPYSFWVDIPLATYGAQTIRFRGFYYYGRQFDEEVREVLRLRPGDPSPWLQ
jgi:hypothetical protein